MTLDGEAPSNAPTPPVHPPGPSTISEAGPSRKGPIAKRVWSPFSSSSGIVFNWPFQALEKRPEVRLLEYADVPGMTICPLLFYAQELAAKRFKKSKPSAPGVGSNSAFFFYFTSVISLAINRLSFVCFSCGLQEDLLLHGGACSKCSRSPW